MPQIGSLPTYHDARRLGAYFRAHGKASRLEKQPGGWAIWMFDDDVAWATAELEAFKQSPNDPRFPPPLDSPEYLIDGLRPLER